MLNYKHRNDNNNNNLALEKAYRTVLAFLRNWKDLIKYVLTLDLIKNAP